MFIMWENGVDEYIRTYDWFIRFFNNNFNSFNIFMVGEG